MVEESRGENLIPVGFKKRDDLVPALFLNGRISRVGFRQEAQQVDTALVKESTGILGRLGRQDGIGCFKAGLSSRGAETEDKFEVQKHIKNLHLIYQPVTRKLSTGKREKVFLSGAKVQRYKEFSAEAEGGGEG